MCLLNCEIYQRCRVSTVADTELVATNDRTHHRASLGAINNMEQNGGEERKWRGWNKMAGME